MTNIPKEDDMASWKKFNVQPYWYEGQLPKTAIVAVAGEVMSQEKFQTSLPQADGYYWGGTRYSSDVLPAGFFKLVVGHVRDASPNSGGSWSGQWNLQMCECHSIADFEGYFVYQGHAPELISPEEAQSTRYIGRKLVLISDYFQEDPKRVHVALIQQD